MSKKIKLFASCIPVKGAERSLICDLQRQTYNLIPNDLFDVLELHDGKSLKEIQEFYNNEFDEILEEYFDFLLEKEFVFLTDKPQLFPKMNLEWHDPSQITNAIIDIDENFQYKNILFQLDELKCKFVEFRIFNNSSLELVNEILLHLEKQESIVYSIGFLLPHSENNTLEDLQNIIKQNSRLSYFIIHSSPNNKFVEPIKEKMGYIYFTKENATSSSHCGLISENNFVVNTKLFTESLNYNSCLNRKISIDKDGNIKNCPSMQESFGNIKNTTLQEALSNPTFKRHWNITKDQIEVCKDCEFRHICTDCRAFVEEPNNQFSKPLKCGYNPYKNIWEDWSTNPLKQKSIEYYGLKDLIKNK